MIRGGCLCGDVAWEFSGAPQFVGTCHCSMCRKATGAAFSMVVAGAPQSYRLTRGKDSIASYESSPGNARAFCSRCGSSVAGVPQPGRPLFMPAGCLEDAPGAPMAAHIFVASKAPWHKIEDDAPRFEFFPPGVEGAVLERPRDVEARKGAVRGTCLCGGVAYEYEGAPRMFLDCHCSRCRRARGAPYASILLLDAPAFRWLRGDDLVREYRVPGARRFKSSFCRVCGSCLPEVDDDGVVLPAGTLDDDPGTTPSCHIFTGSRGWYEIPGERPQYEEYPTGP